MKKIEEEKENEFYHKFYEYCKNVVDIWKENEIKILQDYENNKDKNCFYNFMKKETKDFSGLKNFKNDFLENLQKVHSFNTVLQFQKDFDSKSLANEIFYFQWYLTCGNRSGIEFPVFSDYPIQKTLLKGNEFLRVLRGFDNMNSDKGFFQSYCEFIIKKWVNTVELNSRERTLKREKFKSLKEEIEKEDFKDIDNKQACLYIIQYFKEVKKDYEDGIRKKHPMAELEELLRKECIWNNNERIRNIFFDIRNGTNITYAASLNTPLQKNSEDNNTTKFEDVLIDEKNEHPMNYKDSKLYEVQEVILKYLNYIVMNRRNGMNNEKLNKIAQNIIILVFSGNYDLTTRDGINDIQSKLEKKYKNTDEWSVFVPNEGHGFREIIIHRLESFQSKLTNKNTIKTIPPDDLDLLNKSINGVMQLLSE